MSSWHGGSSLSYSRCGNVVPIPTTTNSSSTSSVDSTQPLTKDSSTSISRTPPRGSDVGRSSNRLPPSGYVTIGSIRYGVRFASSVSAKPQEELPPRGDAVNLQHSPSGDDCCCGAVQLQWTRTQTPSSSRIPLPAAEKQRDAINRRGIFSRINSVELSRGVSAAPVQRKEQQTTSPPSVYRSTLEWSQKKTTLPAASRVVKSCFKGNEDDEGTRRNGVRMKENRDVTPTPTTKPRAHHRIVIRPKPDIPNYFKLCSSASSDSETSYLLTPPESRSESKENIDDSGNNGICCSPSRNTLDRLPKFFGGSGSSAGNRDRERKNEATGLNERTRRRKGRTTDQSEKLRELTEKLKATSCTDKNRPSSSDLGTTNIEAPITCEEKHEATLAEDSEKSVGKINNGQQVSSENVSVADKNMNKSENTGQISAENRSLSKEDDFLECVNLKLPKAESRTIVGSYIQRTIPFRSVSFSQVDFCSADGKYTRSHPRSLAGSGHSPLPLSPASVITAGSLTLPRKKLQDTTPSVSPASSTTITAEETADSTQSVDSAVGSEESLGSSAFTISPTPVAVPYHHKTPGSRSLTYPLPRRGSRSDDDIPFSSIDGNGLKSLSDTIRGIQEVPEENEPHKKGDTLSKDVENNSFLPSSNEDSIDDVNARDSIISDTSTTGSEILNIFLAENESVSSKSQESSKHTVVRQWSQREAQSSEESAACEEISFNDSCEEGKSLVEEVIPNNSFNGVTNNDDKFTDNDLNNALLDDVGSCVLSETEPWNISVNERNDLEERNVLNENSQESENTRIENALQNEVYLTQWSHSEHLAGEESKPLIQESKKHISKHSSEESSEDLIEDNINENAVEKSFNFGNVKNNFDRENDSWQSPKTSDDSDSSKLCSGEEHTPSECATQDDLQSPEPNNSPPVWPSPGSIREGKSWADRPRLTCQSSEEREDDKDESKPLSKRYPILIRADSLSEGDSDQGDRHSATTGVDRERGRTASPSLFSPSDVSDSEGRGGSSQLSGEFRSTHTPRRYSKRPLRGPYGQMLEAEMKKPETTRMLSKKQYNEDLKFLEDYVCPKPERPASPVSADGSQNTQPEKNRGSTRHRALTTHSLDDSHLRSGYGRSVTCVSQIPSSRPSYKRKVSVPYSPPCPASLCRNEIDSPDSVHVCHQRTISSPSQLEGYSRVRREDVQCRPEPTPELLEELLRGSSERVYTQHRSDVTACNINDSSSLNNKDTRTHVVVELYDTERSYVESLQILVMKYLQPLKSPENSGLVDASLVDEIFYQVPAILSHHEIFLEELRKRLEQWDIEQKVGDIFLDVFTKQTVIETYTSFINNWMSAKETIKAQCKAKPDFARFLDTMAREHKGKLTLDHLLIKPVQRIPRYELLMQRLLKHTDPSHPDHQLLIEAQREVHELAVKINCTERETLEYEQQQQTLKELEGLIDGLSNLVAPDRCFLRHDVVAVTSGQGTRKERMLFLFSDMLIITSIKRRSGTIRKPTTSYPGSITGSLDGNKYKLLRSFLLDNLEIVKAKDENVRRMLKEIEELTEDMSTLTKVVDLVGKLHSPHNQLEENVKEMLSALNKQLTDKQANETELSLLELTVNSQNGTENLSVIFTKPDRRSSWEESFSEAKQKLALFTDRRYCPEFIAPLPIRKTRAGLQFTCAAPTLGLNSHNMRDVWVCNSDGYVGQVCVLSLQPEPTVISCNGVCNARILCIASIPAGVSSSSNSEDCDSGHSSFTNSKSGISISVEDTDTSGGNIQLDSSSSSEDEEDEVEESLPIVIPENDGKLKGTAENEARVRSASETDTTSSVPPTNQNSDDSDNRQPTMWLGTEDGCIHVYNCNDNIRIKKNKIKIQHGSSVHCIVYLDNRVFVSLANGDVTVYVRDIAKGWNITDPYTVSIGTAAYPVTRMLPVSGKLWCCCHNTIKILNTSSLQVEHSFQVNPDSGRSVTCMASSGLGMWITLQNSALVRLYHVITYEALCEVNITPAVTKMLASCDDIIRQHKAACLRVTSLLTCKDLLWIGTSAGVILVMPLPHITTSTSRLINIPTVTGVPHGHTGHVRLLTCVEAVPSPHSDSHAPKLSMSHHRHSLKNKSDFLSQQNSNNANVKVLVISGGDGYEDFRTSTVSEVAGREDSTNHLLLFQV